jgi:hypothetical protein
MKYLCFAAALLALVFVACQEDNPPPPPAPTMTIMEAPAFLAANVDSCYTFRVQLANVDADSVTVDVYQPDGSLHSTFALYDDGSLLPAAPPDYACSHSGDIWANDGQFTRRINARLLADTANTVTGAYDFRFIAPQVAEQRLTVHIENVEPCLITSFTQMGNLPECFSPVNLEVRVSRTEGDLVDSVTAQFHVQGHTARDLVVFDAVAGDSVWQSTLTPSAFRCLFSDSSYTAEYQVWTRFGMHCEQTTQPFSFTNSLPSLSNSTLPDTTYRPPADSSLIVVTVDLEDCELQGSTDFFGYLDFPGVKFDVYRDPNPWGHNPDFFLRDDGTVPDVNGGDGTYSSWLVIPHSDSLFDNMYYFRFYAVECAEPYDTSEFLLDSIRIIQPSGLVTNRKSERIPAGSHFAVLN